MNYKENRDPSAEGVILSHAQDGRDELFKSPSLFFKRQETSSKNRF